MKTFVHNTSAECRSDGDPEVASDGREKTGVLRGSEVEFESSIRTILLFVILRDNSMSTHTHIGVTDVPAGISELNMSIVWPLAQFTDRERGAVPATENGSSFYAPFLSSD